MRHPVAKLCVLICAGTLFLCCEDRAQAGFVVPDLESSAIAEPIALQSGSAGMEVPDDASDRFPEPQKAERDVPHAALASQSSSMSSNGSVTSASSAPVVAQIVDAPVASNGQLTAYLLAEPALQLPVPYLDGVFRPPKAQ